MSRVVRIALCQLSSHPAFAFGDHRFIAEPFGATDRALELGQVTLDAVSSLQNEIARDYVSWSSSRVQEVLAWLSKLNPVPHIVVFPEGSIVFECLYLAHGFAREYQAAVFAGTHSPPRLNARIRRQYETLGLRSRVIDPGEQYLPVFCGNESYLQRKLMLSPFEHTDVSFPRASPARHRALSLRIRGTNVRCNALVCAEALHAGSVTHPCDVCVIPAYAPRPEYFRQQIDALTSQKTPIVFCNDGVFGRSGVFAKQDERNATWWWDEHRRGEIPTGDAILVVDIDLDNTAPQSGVVNPSKTMRLVALSAITHAAASEHRADTVPLLSEVGAQTDTGVREYLLSRLLSSEGLSDVERLKVSHLASLVAKGTDHADWWRVLGTDCVLNDSVSLETLERGFALRCGPVLQGLLANVDISDDRVVARMTRIVRACKERAPLANVAQADVTSDAPLDRQHELATFRTLLDANKVSLILVSGFEYSGKHTLIQWGLRSTGRLRHTTIDLTPDTTPEYLASTLAIAMNVSSARLLGMPGDEGPDRVDVTRAAGIIIIRQAHFLLQRGDWRDIRSPGVLSRAATVLKAQRGTLVCESLRQFDIDELAPGAMGRIVLRGLDDDSAQLLLERNLRRNAIDPTSLEKQKLRDIVILLGCHPGAIILCADFIARDGLEAVIRDLRARKGAHSRIVRRFMTTADLSKDEMTILSVLNEIRVPVSSEVLASIVPESQPIVFELWRASFVHRGHDDRVEISPLIRGYAEIPECSPKVAQRLHSVLQEHFAKLAQESQEVDGLRWAVESRYHGALAGCLPFGPAPQEFADGSLGALREMMRRHEYERAKPIADELLKSHRSAETCECAAITYGRLSHLDEALALAKEVVALNPRRTWVLSEVGRLALHCQREDLAESAIGIARALGRDDAYIAVLEGRVLLRQNQPAKALVAFSRGADLAEVDGSSGWPFVHWGQELLRNGVPDEAIAALMRGENHETARPYPNRRVIVAIRTQLAVCHIVNSEMDVAQRYLALVVDEDPGNPEVARASILFKAVAGKQLIKRTFLDDLNPWKGRNRYERSQIHLYRGLFLLALGEKSRASEEFSSANRADPRNVFVMQRWANTLVELAKELRGEGNHEAARQCAEQARDVCNRVLDVSPGNDETIRVLEQLSDEFNVT